MEWEDDPSEEIKQTKRRFIKLFGSSSIVIFLIFISLVGYGIHWAFYDTERLPKGELISQSVSPNGTYTVKAYLVNGGMTVDYAIRGELINNNKKTKSKNIYWNYHESEAQVRWIDDETVIINRHSLNVTRDVFDWRK